MKILKYRKVTSIISILGFSHKFIMKKIETVSENIKIIMNKNSWFKIFFSFSEQKVNLFDSDMFFIYNFIVGLKRGDKIVFIKIKIE